MTRYHAITHLRVNLSVAGSRRLIRVDTPRETVVARAGLLLAVGWLVWG